MNDTLITKSLFYVLKSLSNHTYLSSNFENTKPQSVHTNSILIFFEQARAIHYRVIHRFSCLLCLSDDFLVFLQRRVRASTLAQPCPKVHVRSSFAMLKLSLLEFSMFTSWI